MPSKISFISLTHKTFVQAVLPVLGILVVYSVFPDWQERENWVYLFVFTLLTLIGTFAPITTFKARLTLNNAIIFSALILYGVWLSVWCALIELSVITFLFRAQKRAPFNAGQMLVTLWFVNAAAELFANWSVPLIVTDVALIWIYWLINTFLASSGVSYFNQSSWKATFISMVMGGTPAYIMLLILGDFGSRLFATYGVSALALLGLAFIVISFLFRQYFRSIYTLEQKVTEIKHLNTSFLTAMAAAIDARDPYTHGHSYRVAYWSREIAKKIGLSSKGVDDVYYGGILHDIGKIGIEDDILNKTSFLTPEEFDKIKQHPVIGHHIIEQAGVFLHLIPAIRSHHERIDGRGYPDGIAGESIPLVARILAVSDAFDAMVSDRPYRKGLGIDEALRRLEEGSGTQFDEYLAAVFIEIIRNTPKEQLDSMLCGTQKSSAEIATSNEN